MQDFRTRGRRFHYSSILKKILFPRKNPSLVTNVMFWSRLTMYAFFGLVACVVITIGLFIWYSKDLPTPGKLVNNDLSQSTRIYDRNGTLLYSVYKNENRAYVQLHDIPLNLQHATVAIEDKTFYQDQGFSITGYLRSIRDILLLRGISGGSTITQQLVKNVLLSQERTLPRKIKELILSIQVNKIYSKNQIIEMYLNDVGYGGANTGVEAAAEAYFGKHVKDLDLAQCAFLAGLPQDPNIYDPYNGGKYYIARTQTVLQAMADQSFITQKMADAAFKEVRNFTFSSSQDASIKAPWFILNVIKPQLIAQFGDAMVENGGLQVTTTLDYTVEQKAEQIVQDQVTSLKSLSVGNGAAIVMDPKTDQVLAMVGGRNYFGTSFPNGCTSGVNCVFDPNINAAMISRQPGSSLKPIMYATAFEKGYTASSMVMDAQTDFPTGDPTNPTYTPVNYDGKYRGPVELRFALANSLNIPAVKMLARVGIKDTMQNAYNMGIRNWQPTAANMQNVGLSLVLGGRETTLLDEVTAYSVFATGGIKHNPVFILKVTDSKGNTLFQSPDQQGTRVLPENVTFLISHILSDNNARSLEFGTYSSLVIPGKTVSVKTGTTDNKHDNWTVGYTPDYVVGVWVGNDDNSAMNQQLESGITGAATIWNAIMSYVLKGKPDNTWLEHPPSDVNALQVDAQFGGLPVSGQPTRSEYFIKGTEPTAPSPVYKTIDGKIYYVIEESDPVSTDGQNRWQAGIDDWIKKNHSAADWQWYPPSSALTGTPTPSPTPTP